MPTALVTGATGFVGSHLVDRLLDRGWRVTAVLRPESRPRWLDGRPLERLTVDFRGPFELPPADVVFHVAGVIRADSYAGYLEGNRDLARRVFEASRAGRFVHVSSLAAAGPGENLDEEKPCAPISHYGRSKWEGEREVWSRRDRMPVTIVRPCAVYGPRDMAFLELFRTVARGVRPEVGGPKRISLVHVADLVEGLLRAAEAPEAANEIFFLAHPEPLAVSEFLDLLEEGLGRRGLRVAVPDRVVRFLGAVVEDGARWAGLRPVFGRDKALEMTQPAWTCNPRKAARLLGWRARIDPAEGLRTTLAWYRERGLL
jgi:nucleoside-diphosphate-sugar epimerase